jgi:hypothetical protein
MGSVGTRADAKLGIDLNASGTSAALRFDGPICDS